MFSTRFTKIIRMFLETNDYLTYQQIGDALQTSSRTVMREITQNKKSLEKFDLLLQQKKGFGLRLDGTIENIDKLRFEVEGLKVDYVDKEERQELLCIAMLSAKEIQKLFYYSNMFQVSQATISNDIVDLDEFFTEYHLTVEKRPGIGVFIKGEEINKRSAMSVMIQRTMNRSNSINRNDRYSVDEVITQIKSQEGANFVQLLDYEVLKGILEVFVEYKKELQLDDIAQSSYFGLLIHLSIAITRVLQNQTIDQDISNLDFRVEDHFYDRAKLITSCLEKSFNITFPKIECVFIAIHLQSAKVNDANDINSDDNHDLLIAFFNELKVVRPNVVLDLELYQNLSAHLKPAMIRHENRMPIFNPLLSQIKENYKDVFEDVKQAAHVFSSINGQLLNEDEIGYLVLHVAASIERSKSIKIEKEKIQVGIICASGIGVSSLLVARIKKIVDSGVELVQLSLSQLETVKCPLYVATFDIKKENSLIIDPLLIQSDVVNILTKIEEVRKNNQAIPKYVQTEIKVIKYAYTMQLLLDSVKVHRVKHDISSNQILSLFANSMNDSTYIKESLQKREKLNSNVYHDFNFAMFHSTLDIIDECVLHVATCNEGEFSDESLHDIKIVLCAFIPRNATLEQRKMMSYITTLFIESVEIIDELQNFENTNSVLEKYLRHELVNVLNG